MVFSLLVSEPPSLLASFTPSVTEGQPPSLLAQVEGEQLYFYHVDHLGTPLAVTDNDTTTETGPNIVWQWQYGPFGEEPIWMEPNIVNQNLRFSGQYYDAESGLFYNFHRNYSSKLGRYTTPDQVGGSPNDPQMYNPYPYGANNPINFADPSGLWTSEGHVNLTNWANNSLGSKGLDDIQQVINSNLYSDFWSTQTSRFNYRHYMPGSQGQAAQFINDMLQVAVQKECSGDHTGSLEALGYGLHTLQDYYAHFLTNYTTSQHFPGGPNYDVASENPSNFAQALNSTRDYIRSYLNGIKNKCCKQ